ncbi:MULTISPECIES: hypothetical protein [unclassified Caballeronia]|uniref:hypothetical protein n=1 Tax=unclassified Caballeronia TaxID=2646786 RepID=UPI00202905FC|nr:MULTISPECIES: hypothetical protein [unclassified Caballeronia]
MTKIEILIAIQILRTQLRSSELSRLQKASELLALADYAKRIDRDDKKLQHDLMITESLVVLKRLDQASERLKQAILGTWFRPPLNTPKARPLVGEATSSATSRRHDMTKHRLPAAIAPSSVPSIFLDEPPEEARPASRL